MAATPPHRHALAALVPDWKASPRVRAFVTGRHGGVSRGIWGLDGGSVGGLNLGAGCGDEPHSVDVNRRRLAIGLPSAPVWLHQVHGVAVHVAEATGPDDPAKAIPEAVAADAAVTACPARVLAVLTADCLPVFLADRDGRAIGVAHAGWRGLSGGVLENAVAALRELLPANAPLLAWLGPAIGPDAFEVGRDVVEAFCDTDPGCQNAFVPGSRPDKWFADLYRLARRRLSIAGVEEIGGGGFCTFTDRERFWSYRREPPAGRMASVIWIEPGSTSGA